nr:NADH dehydrogenase subunit 5 [Nemalecium lighti]
MEILIVILPILNFLLIKLTGRRLGNKGAKILTTVFIGSLAVLSVFTTISYFTLKKYKIINLLSWLKLGLISIPLTFQFDFSSSLVIFLISFVSFLIHVYSMEYMESDPHLPRFLGYLSLFTGFMLILVLSNNFILLFLGWEGVGICSYLLIGFWYSRIQASKAAVKAMVVNKIGDLSLICGVIILWSNSGSIEFNQLFLCSDCIDQIKLDIALYLVIVGIVGKSAQIGLHMWLPDAMEGPTPVSALIHAATMVTAGVFLIIKLSPLFNQSSSSLLVITFFGSITALISSTIGLTQNDLKKVIAYSTCSQLGFMTLICGFSFFDVGLFHLINHGFFKGLLFLSAGSIIHGLANNQDMRTMGNSILPQPLTFSCFIIGSLALGGLPFLSGFYSKDLIVELIIDSNRMMFGVIMAIIATLLTSIYSSRLLIMVFWNKNNSSFRTYNKSHEAKDPMFYVIIILSLLSILAGFLSKWVILEEFNPPLIINSQKLSPLILTLAGFLIIILINKINLKLTLLTKKVHAMLIYAWYFDSIINYLLIMKILSLSFIQTYKIIDNQIIEYFGPRSLSSSPIYVGSPSSKWASGSLILYILYVILFIIIFKFIFN